MSTPKSLPGSPVRPTNIDLPLLKLDENLITPVGRGALLNEMIERSRNRGVGVTPLVNSEEQFNRQATYQSAGNENHLIGEECQGNIEQASMIEVIKQMGQELRDSIISGLSASNLDHSKVNTDTAAASSVPDWAKVNLIMKSDVREPPIFRGDVTDKCNVYEWQEMMQTYLSKKGYKTSEQGREMLDRLMGRAKDLVKIGIRNNPLVNISRDPEVIYSILKQHFGEAISSTTPLADFYATLPDQGESSLDYWVRLNKAADLANECLQRQGRQMEDVGHEVAMMFVKYCPNSELCAAFRCKPREKWSVGEVQEMLDCYQNDKRATRRKAQHTMTVQGNAKDTEESPEPRVVTSAVQGVLGNVEQTQMDKLVTMFEQFLKSQSSSRPAAKAPRRSEQLAPSFPCAICKDRAHSTRSHCLNDRLCFSCHNPGHESVDCPQKQNKRRVPDTQQTQASGQPLN